MSRNNLKQTMIAAMILVGVPGCSPRDPALAQSRTPKTRLENIALGKPYTLQPKPDYGLTTDADDSRQLTDGQYSKRTVWMQTGTVGWTHSLPTPIVITVDLGRVQPIRGASYNTAAREAAGVNWPQSIHILVSDDGRDFREAGDLIALSSKYAKPPRGSYAEHRFWTEELRTHGRYVSFVVSGKPYVFADEIEVYRGDPAWLSLPEKGHRAADPATFFQWHKVRHGVMRRLRADAAAVRAKVRGAAISNQKKQPILAALNSINAGIGSLPAPQESEARITLPLNPLHARIFRTQASLWRAQGYAPLTVWQTGLWEPLSPTGAPTKGRKAAVSVTMMRGNEYRAGAFNLTNTTTQDRVARVRIMGLPGGANPSYVVVHEVAWTDTAQGVPVAAALPQARRTNDGFLIPLTSGLTRQVWLTFHGANIPPGLHRGQIIVTTGSTTARIPLSLRVSPLRFPEQPTLHLGGWDYTNQDSGYEITPANREQAIALLRRYFVDSPWATGAALPTGQYDRQGRMTTAPDTSNFDRWQQRWPGARQYCIFANVDRELGGHEIGTAAFENAVGEWIGFWADYLRGRGLKPQQLVLLLVDEPQREDQDEIIIAWANAIHRANTGVKVWENPTHRNPAKSAAMMAAVDVIAPARTQFLMVGPTFRGFYAGLRRSGKELGFYASSGPSRLLDPYAYYRLQAWTCWQYGATGSYFWSFADAGGTSSWDEYRARRDTFVPFFLGPHSVVSGKHLEAIREGLEDYEYLVMLRRRVSALRARGVRNPALDRASNLLAGAAGRVSRAYELSTASGNPADASLLQWHQKRDRSVADRVRVELLDSLSALSKISS